MNARQLVILVAIGAALWLAVALLLRAIAPLQGIWVVVLYLLVVPATVPLIVVTRRLAGLTRARTLAGVAVITGTASLLDGTALVAARALYGANPLGAAAAILWGVGVALLLGVAMSRPARG